jgi:CBS domain-containing protein
LTGPHLSRHDESAAVFEVCVLRGWVAPCAFTSEPHRILFFFPFSEASLMLPAPVTARDMMVRNLITLSPEMDVLDAIDVLLRHRISGAPVVDRDGYFIGIFSEKSSISFIVDAVYEQMPSTSLMPFVDVDPPRIDEDTDLLAIAQTFLDSSCRRLPVIDESGRLRGQISRRDIMRAVRQQLRQVEPVHFGASLYLSALYDSGQRPF